MVLSQFLDMRMHVRHVQMVSVQPPCAIRACHFDLQTGINASYTDDQLKQPCLLLLLRIARMQLCLLFNPLLNRMNSTV